MALVVLLKGVNVGGHRTFRPSLLAARLKRFDVVNIGAAGTFVVHNAVTRIELRAAITRRLPFAAHVMICEGGDILRLVSDEPFAGYALDRDMVRFVSVLAKRREPRSTLPLSLPSDSRWSLKILTYRDRFVLGLYRREMKAIGYLEEVEKVFGAACTTRSWNTVLAIGNALRREKVGSV